MSPQHACAATRLRRRWAHGAAVVTVVAVTAFPGVAAAGAPSDDTQPDLVALLDGFAGFWTSDGTDNLHGTVIDAQVLARNDEVVTWINNNATAAQQFSALQTSKYDTSGTAYDESVTIAPGLGSVLAPLYVQGRQDGSLPLTSAVISSEGGSSGDFVEDVGTAKDTYSYPRPFLASDTTTPPVGEPCTGTDNGTSLKANRVGKPYADAVGNLNIVRVAGTTDTTHEFADTDVSLDPGYAGLCSAGSFPSGHTTTAYQAGITLATLLPELGPEILTRASEQGNNRMVLGVHYPLDVMSGRIAGEAGIATRWSDEDYRETTLEPARAELVAYLEDQCGDVLAACIARSDPYQDDPYGGLAMPGGSDQIVKDRGSAVAVYTERLSYGFAPPGPTNLAPDVPAGAENLLLTTFPTLTDAQRTSVLAQTEIASGFALDQSGTGPGSWQRLDLAAAMSAEVQLDADATVTVLGTGGQASVVDAAPVTSSTPPPTDTTSSSPVAPTETPSSSPVSPTNTPTSEAAPTVMTLTPTTAGPTGTAAAGELAWTGVSSVTTVWLALSVAAVGFGLLVAAGARRRAVPGPSGGAPGPRGVDPPA